MLIYDIEIKKAIPERNGVRLDDIEYCEGWHDHANMGIAVIGAFDYVENRYRVFMDDNLGDFVDLLDRRKPVVGFNHIAFDNQVCLANGIEIKEEDSYDILVEIWKAAGLAPTFRSPSHAGYGLDAVSETNFNRKKTGHGARAPVLWQQGKIGQVVDYCLNDVMLTLFALERIIKIGGLVSPKTGEELKIPPPLSAQAMGD